MIRDVEQFRRAVAAKLGLHFDATRLPVLTDVLARRAAIRRCSRAAYLARIDAGDPDELAALASALTVGETYFFRNPEQLRAFAEDVLPDRARARAGSRRLRILSAGCASGEEPYTLAMIAREVLGDGWAVEIVGADVSPAALQRARRGRYSPWSLREVTPERRRRWFQPADGGWELAPELRGAVRFVAHNLAAEDPGALLAAGTFDVVFCRNVLMYFAPDAARAAVARLAAAVAAGGYLFVGDAETLRGLTDAMVLRQGHGAFYYQRGAAPRRDGDGDGDGDGGRDWFEAIEGATERILHLTARARRRTAPPAPTPAAAIAGALDRLRRERYDDALALLDGVAADGGHAADLLLLRAVLLAQVGRLDEAAAASRRLLALDDRHAGAHYVLALCRDGAGDPAGAREHDLAAIRLDPGFAMPRLHLGLLARRSGRPDTADAELARARELLPGEDPARLLLFGGGFSREALMALCRSELRACGGGA